MLARLEGSAGVAVPQVMEPDRSTSYWLKGSVQQGLVCELIIGRLAHMVGAGPLAQIIRVTPGCLPADGSATHVEGVVVGSRKLPDVCNARDLAALLGEKNLPERSIEPASRARVVTFQSWLGIHDGQVLVDVSSGKVFSIDHGDAFHDLTNLGPPDVVITSIDQRTDQRIEAWDVIEDAVSRIERISDSQLLGLWHMCRGMHGDAPMRTSFLPLQSPVRRFDSARRLQGVPCSEARSALTAAYRE